MKQFRLPVFCLILLCISTISCAGVFPAHATSPPGSAIVTPAKAPADVPKVAAITSAESANDALVKAEAVRVFIRDAVANYYVENGPNRERVRDTFREIDKRFTTTYTACRRLADFMTPDTVSVFRQQYASLTSIVADLKSVIPKKE